MLEVYLEPGEAVALNAGFLVTTVLDIMQNGIDIAILDTSAACHMPDVLEMPYRPPLQGAGQPGEKPYTFRLGGPTCLAGDVIGDYSFDRPLHPGDQLVFEDMALYSMVKTNTFNGMVLPPFHRVAGSHGHPFPRETVWLRRLQIKAILKLTGLRYRTAVPEPCLILNVILCFGSRVFPDFQSREAAPRERSSP